MSPLLIPRGDGCLPSCQDLRLNQEGPLDYKDVIFIPALSLLSNT